MKTYYFDELEGNDSNDGLSWNTAKKSVKLAFELYNKGNNIKMAKISDSKIIELNNKLKK